MNIGRITFGDSKAIKITNDMRKHLNSFNEKKNNIDKLKAEINDLENSRIQKQSELNELNIKLNSEDKKEAKETTKKIKSLEKEIHKFDTNIKNTNSKLEKIVSKNHNADLSGIVLKSINNIGKESEPTIDIPVEDTNIEPASNTETIPSVDVSTISENIIDNEPTENANEIVAEETPEAVENIDTADEPSDLANELDFDVEQDSIIAEPDEPIIENDIKLPDIETKDINPSYNFLSPQDLDKMWNDLNNTVKEEPIVEEPIDIPAIEEPKEFSEEKDTENENVEQEEEFKGEDDIIEESEENKAELENEIEKPDIFSDDSKFYKIVSKEITKEPLLEESKTEDLIPYSGYNDYVFKFGQNHYNKEALTPAEISDLSNVEGFLTEDDFTLRRSGQYNEVVEENNTLRDKIVKIDEDYKKQIEDLTNEHRSNLDELDKLIDSANDKINAYKARIAQLEKLNKSLTDTVNEQDTTIENLNSQNNGLQDTIVNLNEKITNLEEIKENQSNKISDYEDKFKEVLTIVKEVK